MPCEVVEAYARASQAVKFFTQGGRDQRKTKNEKRKSEK